MPIRGQSVQRILFTVPLLRAERAALDTATELAAAATRAAVAAIVTIAPCNPTRTTRNDSGARDGGAARGGPIRQHH